MINVFNHIIIIITTITTIITITITTTSTSTIITTDNGYMDGTMVDTLEMIVLIDAYCQ